MLQLLMGTVMAQQYLSLNFAPEYTLFRTTLGYDEFESPGVSTTRDNRLARGWHAQVGWGIPLEKNVSMRIVLQYSRRNVQKSSYEFIPGWGNPDKERYVDAVWKERYVSAVLEILVDNREKDLATYFRIGYPFGFTIGGYHRKTILNYNPGGNNTYIYNFHQPFSKWVLFTMGTSMAGGLAAQLGDLRGRLGPYADFSLGLGYARLFVRAQVGLELEFDLIRIPGKAVAAKL